MISMETIIMIISRILSLDYNNNIIITTVIMKTTERIIITIEWESV